MITIEKVDTSSKEQVKRFIEFHYDLYRGTPQWVPPIRSDIRMMLNRQKHPFYEHSDADFFMAVSDGKVVGRIATLENRPYNKVHESHQAVFYLFDSIDDQEVANTLFNRAFEWARNRKLDNVVGPKGFSPFDGYGILIEGYEHRQMMTMMNYNFDYYVKLVETLGFEKEVDFVSCYMHAENFNLPEKVTEISRRVLQRGSFAVKKFANKKELISWAWKIGEAYNKTFINNWEYYPFTQNEIKFVVDSLLTIADPNLIKIITYKDEVVGFLFAFHDVSAALQRAKGNVDYYHPLAIADLLMEIKKTKWVSLNGAGVLPEYWGRGGNALMYTEMRDTILAYPQFEHAELTQVAETTKQMRADLINVGGKPYKNHRVYHKKI